jgi:phage tail-like protein
MPDERNDPFRSFNFRLEIDNLTVAAFSEVSGLQAESEVAEYRTGNDQPLHARKLPGLHKHGNITLKRGMLKDRTLWDWYANIAQGVPDRRNGTVILMDEQRHDVLRWHFEAAWPHKISVSEFKAIGNEIAVESIELVIETMEVEVA